MSPAWGVAPDSGVCATSVRGIGPGVGGLSVARLDRGAGLGRLRGVRRDIGIGIGDLSAVRRGVRVGFLRFGAGVRRGLGAGVGRFRTRRPPGAAPLTGSSVSDWVTSGVSEGAKKYHSPTASAAAMTRMESVPRICSDSRLTSGDLRWMPHPGGIDRRCMRPIRPSCSGYRPDTSYRAGKIPHTMSHGRSVDDTPS